jgi:hypothetical protein
MKMRESYFPSLPLTSYTCNSVFTLLVSSTLFSYSSHLFVAHLFIKVKYMFFLFSRLMRRSNKYIKV